MHPVRINGTHSLDGSFGIVIGWDAPYQKYKVRLQARTVLLDRKNLISVLTDAQKMDLAAHTHDDPVTHFLVTFLLFATNKEAQECPTARPPSIQQALELKHCDLSYDRHSGILLLGPFCLRPRENANLCPVAAFMTVQLHSNLHCTESSRGSPFIFRTFRSVADAEARIASALVRSTRWFGPSAETVLSATNVHAHDL